MRKYGVLLILWAAAAVNLLAQALQLPPNYPSAQDYWGDPRGSFLAAQNADAVYALFGKTGVGDMPPVETPLGDFIGYHNRKGTHGQNDYDWEQYLNFADRHFGVKS